MGIAMKFEKVKGADKDFLYDFIMDTDGKPVQATFTEHLTAEQSSDKFMQNIEFEMVAETEKVPWLKYLLE